LWELILLIAGNWKLNCNINESSELVRKIIRFTDGKNLNCEIAVFPPYTALSEVNKLINNSANISLGAQDCSSEIQGAFTGDVSVEMLADIGCKYVIVGHSERRQNRGEVDSLVLKKATNAQKYNLIPIVCVGESTKDRNNGNALSVIEKQLELSLPSNCNNLNCVIAYEPIWAIGTGVIPSIEDINEMFSMIKNWLFRKYNDSSIMLLYGGSVNNDNAKELFTCPHLGGLLIGGVSLKADEFSRICINI
tara:strand:- start:6460 stop:7209 length:750 start_codon:yes stop_codon:yes gene_type:complete